MKDMNDFLQAILFEDTDYLIAELKAYFEQQQYVWKDEQIIGFRMSDDYDNAYSDWLVVIKTSGTTQTVAAFQCSTKPGWTWLEKQAVATLKEGQYLRMWNFGKASWSNGRNGLCPLPKT